MIPVSTAAGVDGPATANREHREHREHHGLTTG
jgi:hypothetical protein